MGHGWPLAPFSGLQGPQGQNSGARLAPARTLTLTSREPPTSKDAPKVTHVARRCFAPISELKGGTKPTTSNFFWRLFRILYIRVCHYSLTLRYKPSKEAQMPQVGTSLRASAFPSISNFLFSWIEPTLEAIH
jgi:hypothetical protein